jgi:hypothetical protein
MPVIIWRVTFFEKGEEPIVDNMRRLRDAWVLAQPYPDVDGKDWVIEAWETVKAKFEEEKATSMLVAWASDHTAHTIIDKIEAEDYPKDDD